MKITEINWDKELDKRYTDGDGIVWQNIGGELWSEDGKDCLSEKFNLEHISTMEFTEIVNWETVSIDTKVLVSEDGEFWYKRYFAGRKDGENYHFSNGTTSWSSGFNRKESYKHYKLAE